MKIGTSQFVGSRLREAREARALTMIALAELIGVTRQAVSQYERGDAFPSPTVMDRITNVLGIPLRFFLRPAAPVPQRVVFYRSLASATKTVRVRAERRYQWLREVVSYLRTFIELPAVNLPAFDVPEDPNYLTSDRIEELASETRRFWGLGDGPISNLVLLLENNGVVVSRHKLDCEALDAFSEWRVGDLAPYIVLGSDKPSAARSRLDASHELAHMVLHRRVPLALFNRLDVFKLIEEQAFRFATAFLLPERTFSSSFRVATLDVFKSMKATWKVSIGAMIKRAEHLGLINPDHAQRLWMNRTRRGWRVVEPLDDVLELEQPRLLRRTLDLLRRSGRPVKAELESLLGLAASDIESICGLLPGELDDEAGGPLRLIQPRRSPMPPPSRPAPPRRITGQ
jgi:Zn-dependent peptidase ImmA (M78 family)/transcriptional regulator with XRE-family HTH domain